MNGTILLDTCVISDLCSRRSDYHAPALAAAGKWVAKGAVLAVNDLTCAELMSLIGNRVRLEHALRDAGVRILDHSRDDAFCAGEMRAVMAGTFGRPGRGRRFIVDFIIAAQARRLGALMTRDTGFEPLEKLFRMKVYWV